MTQIKRPRLRLTKIIFCNGSMNSIEQELEVRIRDFNTDQGWVLVTFPSDDRPDEVAPIETVVDFPFYRAMQTDS